MKFPNVDKDVHISKAHVENDFLDGELVRKRAYHVLYIFITCILLWAAFVPFSGGVVIQGIVIAELHNKPVQHLSGGIVDSVLVKDGDRIQKGQPLLKLKATSVDSQLFLNKNQLLTYQMTEARLAVEASDGDQFSISSVSSLDNGSKEFKDIFNNELIFFNSRKSIHNNELKAIQEIDNSYVNQINSLQDSLKSHERQLDIAKKEYQSMMQLMDAGYISQSRLNQSEQMLAEIESKISEDRVNISRTQSSLVDARLKLAQRKQERVREARAQLFDIRRELEVLKTKLTISVDESQRLVLRAPSDGIVMNLSIRASDVVISPGQVVLEIAPTHEELIIEGKLPPHQIDGIHVGLETRIRFTALSKSMPVINGHVSNVSADRISDARNNDSFYMLQAKIDPQELKSIPTGKIIAGMPVELIITTDERTLLNYLFKPIMGFFYKSLNEK